MKKVLAGTAMICLAVCGSVIVSFAATTEPARTDDEPLIRARSPLLEQIDPAASRGSRFLMARQNDDGSWGETGNQQVGETSLVVLALLNSGESAASAPMSKAIDFLRKARPQQTYSVGLRACVFATLPERMRGSTLRVDLNWLLTAIEMKRDDPNEGMYSYGSGNTRGGEGDFSNSQYGVLGVWYAAMSGLEVPGGYWKRVEECWRRAQSPDGGWGYTQSSSPGRPYASMTAAGAATMYITNDYLHAADAQDLNRVTRNATLDLANRWLADHFSVESNIGRDTPSRGGRRGHGPAMPDDNRDRGGATWGNYMLFGFERVGEASGLTRFGDHRWFDEGAAYLLHRQRYDGSFMGDLDELVDTSYALLFLSRGRSPVLMQKLQFGQRWNNRPLDVSNFVHFMRRVTERHTNWQVLSIEAPIEAWRDSPILYVASDRAIDITGDQRDRMVDYVSEGGLIVFVNEGTGNEFAKSAVALCKAMWPAYMFRELPPDHPIRKGNFPTSNWTLPIQGISNGIRELAVMFPSGDASWKWQSNGGAATAKISPFAPLANLSLYVSGKFVPSFKGETTWIARDASKNPPNEIYVARLKHGGNWNPEPGAWSRLANVLHNASDAEVKVTEVSATVDELRQGFAIVDLTSTTALQFNPAEEGAIKTYLDKGGLLFLDAAGTSRAAGASFDDLMARLYPGVHNAAIPLDDNLYTGNFPGGRKLQIFRYRTGPTNDLPATTLPRLRAITVDGRLIAIQSNQDLTAALVGYTTADVTGYTPSTAMALMRNVVLWSATRR